MKSSSTIRFIDKYLGSFLCLLFSFVQVPFKRKPSGKSFDNILFIELFEMGASVMAYPSVHYIKSKFPTSNIYVLTTKSIAPSWLKISEIPSAHVLALDDSGILRFIASIARCIRTINSWNIDVVIDLELFLRITALISFFLKADRKAGFFRYNLEGLYRGNIHNIRCHFNQNSHIARNFLALTKTSLSTSTEHPDYKNSIPLSELTYGRCSSQANIRAAFENRIDISLSKSYVAIAPDVGHNLSIRN